MFYKKCCARSQPPIRKWMTCSLTWCVDRCYIQSSTESAGIVWLFTSGLVWISFLRDSSEEHAVINKKFDLIRIFLSDSVPVLSPCRRAWSVCWRSTKWSETRRWSTRATSSSGRAVCSSLLPGTRPLWRDTSSWWEQRRWFLKINTASVLPENPPPSAARARVYDV